MKNRMPFLLGLLLVTLSCFGLWLTAIADELDPSFGEEGRVATSIGQFGDQAYAVTVQPDGRILVAGSSSNGADLDFAIVRYNQDGSLDKSFNLDGTVRTQIGRADDEIAAIAVQEDWYIVAAGFGIVNGSRNFALARYTPDGELDYSFGLGGIVVTEYGNKDDEITAMTVDDEGRIIVAGYSTGTAGRVVVVGRYLSNGELDLSFGYEGFSLTGIGEDALARSIDVDAEGRIVLAGSYDHEDRTEVMVLRFTENGELDTAFGQDGLAFPAATLSSTEGFGIKLHESGAILVAGLIGSPGELDSALFNFTDSGLPDMRFGDNGMLVTEASREDDMVLAIDINENTIYLSGFTTNNEAREFLYISHQVEATAASEERADTPSVPFLLKAGTTTTSLQINEREEAGSYDEYMTEALSEGMIPVQTVVNSTPFGFFSNDISYAVAVQSDGKAVAAGMSDQEGMVSIAVARYAPTLSALVDEVYEAQAGVNWIVTREPSEVNRTGAFTGGVIDAEAGKTITQRGVVFSIAPDPVLKEGGSDGGGTDPGGGDDGGPVRSNGQPTGTLEAGTTSATLSLNTSVTATCRYATTSGVDYDSMTESFNTTNSTSHSEPLSSLTDGQSYSYSVRCQDGDGNQNITDYTITFSVASARSAVFLGMQEYPGKLGNFIIGTAHAEDLTTGTSTTTVTSTTADETTNTSGVFDLSTPEYALEGYTSDGSGVGSYSSILSNLKPGTFYYVRAYAVTSGGTTYYGNQVGLKTADSCFIATAAFGSILHPGVSLLREFRDQYLVKNGLGRMVVGLYYTYSPPVADVISLHPVLRFIVRMLLLPFIGMSWLVLKVGVAGLVALSAIGLMSYGLVHLFLRRVRAGEPSINNS